jgi:hypothetical protein
MGLRWLQGSNLTLTTASRMLEKTVVIRAVFADDN